MTDTMPRETKALDNDISQTEINERFSSMMRNHHALIEAQEEMAREIESKNTIDVLTNEKVNRLSDNYDRLQQTVRNMVAKSQRPQLEGGGPIVSEQKRAFVNYLRRGDTTGLEQKTLAVGTNSGADGGYTVPYEIEQQVGQRLAAISPIRNIASVRTISGNIYRKPFSTTGFETGWVAETGARDTTDTSVIAALDFPAHELYAMPAATPALLEDSAVNIDEWVASEVEVSFAQQEGTAFVTGNGTNKPKGFLSYTTIANASWEWGKLGFVKTGDADNFADANPSDALLDLIYGLQAGYRQNAAFVLNRKTQAAIRKFKNEQGDYLWTPPAQPGGQAMLMGFPVVEAEDMPDIGADAYPVAFGDFRRGYLVVDRQGIQILRDPYSSKPYVLFYTVKRVGGGVQDFNAIKLLKVSA